MVQLTEVPPFQIQSSVKLPLFHKNIFQVIPFPNPNNTLKYFNNRASGFHSLSPSSIMVMRLSKKNQRTVDALESI